jgi:citrate synthase
MDIQKSMGYPLNYYNTKGYVENFMKLMFEIPTGPIASPVVIEALNKLFILHADHEQNCSTSTVRMVGSSHGLLFVNIIRSFSVGTSTWRNRGS